MDGPRSVVDATSAALHLEDGLDFLDQDTLRLSDTISLKHYRLINLEESSTITPQLLVDFASSYLLPCYRNLLF